MLKTFLSNIDNYNLPAKSRIIIAISAGLDSVALLHLFATTNHISDFTLELAHLSHNIRSAEASEQDFNFVRRLAHYYQLPLHHHSIIENLVDKNGKEQSARTLRRKWLLTLCTAPNDYIALAHHADDQAETIMMRWQQHYPLKGFAGMPEYQPPIIRPLITMSKRELKSYLIAHQFNWIEDETNQDLTIKRNATRQTLRELTNLWPRLNQDLLHLSKLAQEHNHLLKHLMTEEKKYLIYSEDPEYFHYPYSRFITLHTLLRNELLYYAFDHLMRGAVKADYRLPSTFLQSINLKPSRSILLKGHGIIIQRKKSLLEIVKE